MDASTGRGIGANIVHSILVMKNVWLEHTIKYALSGSTDFNGTGFWMQSRSAMLLLYNESTANGWDTFLGGQTRFLSKKKQTHMMIRISW